MLKQMQKQQGLSLIESMVALLVISVGLLGIAALQVTSMKQNNSALHHSQAVWIGYNMADRIRANFAQFNSYNGTDTGSKTYEPVCGAEACAPNTLVVLDQAEWQTEIQNLPGGLGIISQPTADELLIRVMWDDEGTGVNGTACSGDSDKDLTCYSVTINR